MSALNTQTKTQEKEKEQATKELAAYGVDVSQLLLRKALANCTPEAREMFESYRILNSALRAALPDEFPSVQRSYDELLAIIEKVEVILTDEPRQQPEESNHV